MRRGIVYGWISSIGYGNCIGRFTLVYKEVKLSDLATSCLLLNCTSVPPGHKKSWYQTFPILRRNCGGKHVAGTSNSIALSPRKPRHVMDLPWHIQS
jgi:hypothetical protein